MKSETRSVLKDGDCPRRREQCGVGRRRERGQRELETESIRLTSRGEKIDMMVVLAT